LSLADTLCVMRNGRILSSGTPEDLYARPADRYTAQFVGQMVFLRGHVLDAQSVELAVGPVACRLPESLMPGTEVLLGLRPEHIVVADRNGQAPAFEADVIQRLFIGDRVQYDLALGEARLSLRLPNSVQASADGRLCLSFPADRWLVFPAEAAG